MTAYTDQANWPPRNPGECLRAHMKRVCEWQAEQRRIHEPAKQEAIDRIAAGFEAGRNRVHPLLGIHRLMIESRNALIVDDGRVVAVPQSWGEAA